MKSSSTSQKGEEHKTQIILPAHLNQRPVRYTKQNFPRDDEQEAISKSTDITSQTNTLTSSDPKQRNQISKDTDPDERQYEIEKIRREREELEEESKFKNTEIRTSPKESWICLCVDGHDMTKKTFEVVLKEFQPLKDSIYVCPYVYNNMDDEKYNWRFQKQNVFSHYKVNLLTTLSEKKGKLILSPFNANYSSEIEQEYKIALDNMCNFFIVTANGLKGPFFKQQKLKKGIDFLLNTSILPTMIVKDSEPRGHYKNCKGYKWWLVVDRGYSDGLRALNYFLPLIDLKTDFIYCLTLLPKYVQFDDVKEQFEDKMKEIGIDKENTKYEAQYYDYKYMKEVLLEYVNHNEEHYFDYVVFYNNPDAYRTKGSETETYQMVEKWMANLCFVNGAYLDPMFLEH